MAHHAPNFPQHFYNTAPTYNVPMPVPPQVNTYGVSVFDSKTPYQPPPILLQTVPATISTPPPTQSAPEGG